jgi:hypothetical protein
MLQYLPRNKHAQSSSFVGPKDFGRSSGHRCRCLCSGLRRMQTLYLKGLARTTTAHKKQNCRNYNQHYCRSHNISLYKKARYLLHEGTVILSTPENNRRIETMQVTGSISASRDDAYSSAGELNPTFSSNSQPRGPCRDTGPAARRTACAPGRAGIWPCRPHMRTLR